MDLETGLISVGVVVFSAIVILLVSMFGIKETSYEEAIAEQRRLPDDLLFGKKEKVKEKKYKSKSSKKSKEKKEEKEEKEEKSEHVQFEEAPQIVLPELPQEPVKISKKKSKIDKVKPILVNKDEPVAIHEADSQPMQVESNHFEVIQPKDEFELIHSLNKDNVNQVVQMESVINKSPKPTPTKSKKNHNKEVSKKEDDTKDTDSSTSNHQNVKEVKEQHSEVYKEVTVVKENSSRDSKKSKKKNNFLAQLGGDTDGINVSLLMPLVQKAELSRSEIQFLIDQLLNKQLDNPTEYSEWTEGRADPVIKLKKQLAEKEKALAEKNEASTAFQNKLKELRAELNAERSRSMANMRQLEESLNSKVLEVQTLHTRMQHILESHAAEKQGFSRNIEELRAKINEDAAIILKMQEDQGQTQGHMQQELHAQRNKLEVQFAQMRETENSLKLQLAQKHQEVQELQTLNMTVTQDLQATCESSNAEIEMLRHELAILQEQLMHSEGQLQHYKESSDRMQDVIRQLEESRRVQSEMDHRLKSIHRHEQELQKQVSSLQSELNTAKSEALEASNLKTELNNAQAEVAQLRTELSTLRDESQSKAAEVTNVQSLLEAKEEELKKTVVELNNKLQAETKKFVSELMYEKSIVDGLQERHQDAHKHIEELNRELETVKEELHNAKEELSKLKLKHAHVSQKLIDSETVVMKPHTLESRENGVEVKSQLNSQILEYTNTISKKEDEIKMLKTDLTRKEMEINHLNSQIENLRCDVNSKNSIAQRLQDDLEAQRLKHIEEIEKIKEEEHNATKALLRRIFPSIKVQEQIYDEWINTFVEKARTLIAEYKEKKETENVADLEEENKNLQSLVSHYKRIIEETEGMLNKLQNHIETEEKRWQTQLWKKEQEISNLRTEILNVQEKTATNEDKSSPKSEWETT